MDLKLYIVHGSHPCAAVEKALSLKRLDYKVMEWPPPMHAVFQRMMFGSRTVPALRIERAEKVAGSRAIMRRLDELAPAPALYPTDPAKLGAVEEADRWGDEVFQPIARTLIWTGFKHSPQAMPSYTEGSRIPLPAPAIRISAPAIVWAEGKLNTTGDDVAAREMAALPGHLDKIDGLAAAGTIGDPDHPNAADLQIFSTVRLLMTMADVRRLLEGRSAVEHARRLFPSAAGELPAGSIPSR